MTMADDGFQLPLFVDDGYESDDEKLAMDIESFLSVLDEDCVPSEVWLHRGLGSFWFCAL
jgi:hypothetical protein